MRCSRRPSTGNRRGDGCRLKRRPATPRWSAGSPKAAASAQPGWKRRSAPCCAITSCRTSHWTGATAGKPSSPSAARMGFPPVRPASPPSWLQCRNLQPQPGDRVLEIGSGTGWNAAIVACGRDAAIHRIRSMLSTFGNCRPLNLRSVTVDALPAASAAPEQGGWVLRRPRFRFHIAEPTSS